MTEYILLREEETLSYCIKLNIYKLFMKMFKSFKNILKVLKVLKVLKTLVKLRLAGRKEKWQSCY